MGLAILFGVFALGLISGMPVAFALGLATVGGFLYEGLPMFIGFQRILSGISVFSLLAIPFFIFAGELMMQGGIAARLVRLAASAVGKSRGGLGVVNVASSMLFGGISGSAVADTSALGAILMPVMKEKGYDADYAVNVTVTSSVAGVVIPPSHNMILYAVAAGGVSVSQLFIAGVIPGILIAILFSAIVVVIVRLDPAQGGHTIDMPPLSERLRALAHILPVLGLFGFLLGGLYMGVFTPTEGAVVGVFAVLVMGALQRRLSLAAIRHALADAAFLTTMLFMIIVGGTLFTRFLVQTGFIGALTGWMLSMNLGYAPFIIAVTILYLILGCVLDLFGMLILTVPILFPIATSLGIDPVWFGIYIIIVAEIGLVTPPLGVNVYVIKTVAPDVPLTKIFLGCLPFVAGMLAFITLMAVFPQIALVMVR